MSFNWALGSGAIKDTTMIRATISGSFHRHMLEVYTAVHDLRALGVDVLSPSDPTVVGQEDGFVYVASDILRSQDLVQHRHRAAIDASNFLWLVSPDGYVGSSASSEVTWAYCHGIPIYTKASFIDDASVRSFVQHVGSMREAIGLALDRRRPELVRPVIPHFLLDPKGTADHLYESVGRAQCAIMGLAGNRRDDAEDAFAELKRDFASLK